MRRRLRTAPLLLTWVLLSCGGDEPASVASRSAAVTPSVPVPIAVGGPSPTRYLPPLGPGRSVTPSVVADLCPEQKPLRADWADLVAAKKKAKSLAPLASSSTVTGVVAPSSYMQKQRAFLQALKAKQPEFWALSQEEREKQHAQLKRVQMGE